MALLKIDGQLDLDALRRRLETLPRYARPLFLRLAAARSRRRRPLSRSGQSMSRRVSTPGIEDPLYVLDNERWVYVPLDAEQYDAIRKGVRRL